MPSKPTSSPYLSIIVPAYNEAERIPNALLDMNERLEKMLSAIPNFSYELIVVNDGSSDNTVEVVQALASHVHHMRILDLGKNQGKGGAVRAGMLDAKGKIKILTDADNSTSIDQLEKMLPFFKEGYDVVIGSRAIAGAKLEPAEPLHRRIIGRGLNLIIQVFLLPGIHDTQCGFKAFTAEAAERVFSISRISGWGFDVEVLALAKKFNYRIREIPVRWVNDERSHMTFSGGLKFLLDIAKVRWQLWIGSYTGFPRALPKPDVIILAAGHGKRMRSDIAKPLHLVGEKTVLERVIETVKPLNNHPIIVIGHQGEAIKSRLGKNYRWVWQAEQQGTGHAVMSVKYAMNISSLRDNIIILPSDHPLITTNTLRKLLNSHVASDAAVSLCTITVPNFNDGYVSFADHGRIKRSKDGKIQGIIEVKDATEEEKEIKEVNAGFYCFNTQWLFNKIAKLKSANNQNEFYLTDMIALAVHEDATINSQNIENVQEGLGFNTPEQLANILKIG